MEIINIPAHGTVCIVQHVQGCPCGLEKQSFTLYDAICQINTCNSIHIYNGVYLWQAEPRWGSYYTGEPGSTRRSGQVRAGFCRSCDPARTRWSSPFDGWALRRLRLKTRNTAAPYIAHRSHRNGPHTHIHALSGAASSPGLFKGRIRKKNRCAG